MINWIDQNWYYIIFAILLVLILIYGIMTDKVKEWLKYAVAVAESDLGSGTGQLKLRKVYDMFIDTFPFFSRMVPFIVFTKLVDAALIWLKDQLAKNMDIKNVIQGGE